MTFIDFLMAVVSIGFGCALLFVFLASFWLSLPAYKQDRRMSDLAKKLGFGG